MRKAPIGNVFLAQLPSARASIQTGLKIQLPEDAPPGPGGGSESMISQHRASASPGRASTAGTERRPEPGAERMQDDVPHNRVLVIDDEEGFLEEMVETLELHGFDCLAARDAKYGLDIIQDLGTSLSVVL